MAVLVLKVDVDTWLGTRDGVPRLLQVLKRHQVPATFLFSLGPDHTGRAIRRIFRPGFLAKVQRTSVVSTYPLRTLFYGTLLPGPKIAARCADVLRATEQAGHEVGVHAYDHVSWQDNLRNATESWTRQQMTRACEIFTAVFHYPPRVHGAAGWQMNAFVPHLERELGFAYASDVRGADPFMPDEHAVLQWPTTLPTLDELIGRDLPGGLDPVASLLAHTAVTPLQDHIFTLHAELEGATYRDDFERLLNGWREQGREFLSLGELVRRTSVARVALPWPQRRIIEGCVPGRSGTLAIAEAL